MLRPILFLHRWLGIFVGLIMTVWCLSGFVMMYVDYPRLLPAERLRGLAPLQPPAGEAWARIALPDDLPIASARVEMMAGRPVLRVVPSRDPSRPIAQMRVMPGTIDLRTGRPIDAVTQDEAETIAGSFAAFSGLAGSVRSIGPTGIDQWTVQAYRGKAPLYRADFEDGDGTELYLSGTLLCAAGTWMGWKRITRTRRRK